MDFPARFLIVVNFKWSDSMRTTFLMIVAALLLASSDTTANKPLTFDDFISLGRVSNPRLAPDGRHVVFVVEYQSRETNKGNRDLFMIPIEGGKAEQLTHDAATDTDPRFSPDGKWIAFRSTRSGESQIWILPTAGGEAWQVTTLSTGAAHPMWLPDARHIIFTSSVYPDCEDDACNAARIKAKEESKVKARIYDDLFYRHWDEWMDGTRSHVFITSIDGDDARDLTPGSTHFPTAALGSSHDIAVSPDGNEICVAASPNQNPERDINNDLFVIRIDGGTPEVVTTNKANDNHPVYSPDGKHIAYRAMARPGFEADKYRLMLFERATGKSIDIGAELADEYDRSVASIAWSPDSKHLYLTCGDRGHVSLFRVDARSGKVKQLTKKAYVSSLRVGPKGRQLVFLNQTSAMPYEVFRSSTDGSSMKQISHINDETLASIDMNPLEEFTFAGAGGTDAHGFLLKPPGFQPGRKYPLVYLIHGGPQGAWARNFHARWNYQMFAAAGYVVAAVNPRGSTGYGQKFTDEITQDWGGKVYEDLMKGLDHVLATYGSFIDDQRIGAAGASYGGYMINWIAGHTDRFTCLVNHDGVYNFTSFFGTTEELWFPEWEFGGTPYANDPREYEKHSPHTYAKNFKTPMLVIHGGKDYRVDPSEGYQVFTALRRQGVPARFLYFPDEGHWVLKPLNAELWWKTVHEWLAEYLQPDALP
jgi:dipeptidyl aminopeptidase/acylaminoacyl peptidase